MKTIDLNLGGASLLQIANKDHTQSMAYMIQTDCGKTVMIDSANHKRPKDAENLYALLKKAGSKVDCWFITHPHSDHIGGLVYIWEKYGNEIQIDKIVFEFPDREWLKSKNGGHDTFCVDQFLYYVKEYGITVHTPKAGEVLDYGVRFEILNGLLPNYHGYDDANDTGICIKAHFKNRSVLFLGDLGVSAQDDFLEVAKDKLRCDIVQLAHHGQNGVNEKVYRLIKPKVCLWCTPDWLWHCDSGDGIGSGGWDTLLTRLWMTRLGAKEHYVAKDGDYLFI